MKRFLLLSMLIFFASTILSSAGTADNSFGTFGFAVVVDGTTATIANATAVQADGKIVAAGTNGTQFTLVRYNVDGNLDTTFDTDGILTNSSGVIAYAVAVQNDGKIVVAGTNNNNAFIIMRYKSNGVLDSSFGTSGICSYIVGTASATAYAIAIQPADGKIVVAGTVDTNKIVVMRLLPADGALDTTFNNAGTPQGIVTRTIGTATTIYALGLQTDGKIVVAGSSDANAIVARFLADGSGLDTSGFNASGTAGYNIQNFGGTDVAYGLGFQSDGKIIIAGTTGTFVAVARFTTAGVLDTTFGLSSSGYNASYKFSNTTAEGYCLVIQANNKIVIGGTVFRSNGQRNNFLIVRYLADGSGLDPTFNPSNGYTIADLGNNIDSNRAIALQSNNRFVLSGKTIGSTTGSFSEFRYLGDATPQGVIDVTYQPVITVNTNVVSSGYLPYPTDNTSGYKPQVKAVQAQADNSVLVVTENLAAPTKSQLVQLNADGTVLTSAIDIAQIGGTDVIMDSKGRVLVIGTNGTTRGWIARYTITAGSPGSFALDSTFNGGAILVQAASPASTSFSRIGEAADGRIIVMGQNSTTGILIAYDEDCSLDASFGTSGVYSLASKTLTDLVIGSDNGIYITYNGGTNIEVAKIAANGVGYFGGGSYTGAVDTGLAVANYSAGARIALDNSGRLLLAAVNVTTGALVFQRYTTGGVLDVTTTISLSSTNLSSPVITQLQSDTNSQPLFTGYDANYFLVGRLTNSMTLDTSFAPNSSTQGILKTKYNNNNPSDTTTPTRVANAISIAGNGGIVFGGYENMNSTNSVSLIGQVVGNTTPYAQVARYPGSQIGSINTNFGTAGEFSLAASFDVNTTPAAMYVYDSGPNAGKILIATANGSDTVLARFTSAYALDSTFGSTTGKITITGLANPTNLNFDLNGNILVSAGTGASGSNVGKISSVTATGSAVNWTTSGTALLDYTYGVLNQSSSRLIVYGQEDGVGVLLALNQFTGAVDTFFGNNGRYVVTGSTTIPTAAIDAHNNIIVGYTSSNNLVLASIAPNGYGTTAGFSFTGTALISITSSTNLRLAIDVNGKIAVVAKNSTGNFIARRYTSTGANDAGLTTVTLTNPSGVVLQNIVSLQGTDATINGATLILGYNTTTTPGKVIVARLNPAFAVDTTFAANGIQQATTVGTLTTFQAIDLLSDKTILVAGYDSTTTKPALTNLYSDYLATKVAQNPTTEGLAGTLDTTFGTLGVLNMHTGLTSAGTVTQFVTPSQAKKIVNLANGNYMVAADNGTNTYITQFYGIGDQQVASFGTNGMVTLTGLYNVNDLFIGQDGNLLVCGSSGGGTNAAWVKRITSSTGVIDSTFTIITANSLDTATAVCQQTSGRILVAGMVGGNGAIVAYNSITGALDTTFGTNGFYSTGIATSINDMVVGPDDSIYFIANDIAGSARTYKLNEFGSARLWISSELDSVGAANVVSNHILLDQSNIPVIVAVSGTKVYITRYNASTGAAVNSFNSATTFTAPVVTSMIVDINGKFIFAGNDGTTTTFVARVLANLSGFDTTFNGTGIQGRTISSGNAGSWNSLVLNAAGKVNVVGYATIATVQTPYMMRLFGDAAVGQYLPTVNQGAAGTLDTNVGTVSLGALGAGTPAAGSVAQAVLNMSNGSQYIAMNNGYLMLLTNAGILDTTYNSGAVTHPAGFAVNNLPTGTFALLYDGSSRVLAAGTNGSGGWVQRYVSGNSGLVDTTGNGGIGFNTTGTITLAAGSIATVVAEQTLGRVVVAGANAAGNGVINAYTNTGTVDTTFGTNGVYTTGIAAPIYAMAVDQYDRILIAYKHGSAVDLVRLCSNGVVDTTFATNGFFAGVIGAAVDQAAQVRLVLDYAGNIIVAAHVSTGGGQISIRGITSTGTSLYTALNITTLTAPTLTTMQATTDGRILVGGYQSTTNPMWIASVTVAGALYPNFGTAGIMTFQFDGGATARQLQNMAIYGNGEISMVGSETNGTVNPFLSRAYNNPYTAAVTQSPDSRTTGTNDITFGVAGQNGITFYVNAGTNQIAQAVAVEGTTRIFAAVNDQIAPYAVYLQAFNIDGLVDTTFNTTGSATVVSTYQRQAVQDMLVFNQNGVNKAILAGYARNTTLNVYTSLLLQYNLDTPGADTTFGRLSQDVPGSASGDVAQFYSIARQSTGQIIASGINYDNAGAILGYTTNGLLDNGFGSGGCYFSAAATTGIYSHVVDTQDRVLFVYKNSGNFVVIARLLADGSGLDTTFGSSGIVTTAITPVAASSMRVAVDASNNVYVAVIASNSGVHNFVVTKYTSTGGSPVTTGYLSAASFGFAAASTLTLSRLLIDANGKAVVIGYGLDSGSTQTYSLIARTTTAVTGLDTTFNPTGTPGYIRYQVTTTTLQSTDGLIHPDGRIITSGFQS